MLMRIAFHLLICSLSVLTTAALAQETGLEKRASPVASDSTIKDKGAPKEGGAATLPQGVVRTRVPMQWVSGQYGFDGKGKSRDLGFKTNVLASAIVLEIGLTRDTTFQLMNPVIIQNELQLDGNRFRKTKIYQQKYGEFSSEVAELLQDRGICPDERTCKDLIASGYALPQDEEVTLPTGEVVLAKAGVPLRAYADALVVGGATPAEGGTGLGDLQLGALTNVVRTETFSFSVGYGVRLPTGEFANVPSAFRSTGKGITDLGLRLNADYLLADALWLNFQNQTETAITRGRKRKTSMLNNERLNKADPTSPAALASGSDGESNTQTYELRGASQVGYLSLSQGLGVLVPSLKIVTAEVGYHYALGRIAYLDGIRQGDSSLLQSTSAGVSVTGLPYSIPMSVGVDYQTPIAGRDVTIATSTLSVLGKAYVRF